MRYLCLKRTLETLSAIMVAACLAWTGPGSGDDTSQKPEHQECTPSSGYIHKFSYGLDNDGRPRGQTRSQKIWFAKSRTRTDDYIEDVHTMLCITGESWQAFPATQRILHHLRPSARDAYAEETRKYFARRFSDRQWSGREIVCGLPCWRYAWREEVQQPQCVLHKQAPPMIETYDVTYWVYSNPQFPCIMKDEVFHDSLSRSRTEVTEIQLDCPVPEATFARPEGFKQIAKWDLPEVPFEIEIHHTRVSKKHGGRSEEMRTYSGDGVQVKSLYQSRTIENFGKPHDFSKEETIDYRKAKFEMVHDLDFIGEWSFSKKIGEDTILGMRTDVLEGLVENVPRTKSWVADHEVLGTIRVREEKDDAGETEVTEVTKLECKAR